jgi:hypothetical protein
VPRLKVHRATPPVSHTLARNGALIAYRENFTLSDIKLKVWASSEPYITVIFSVLCKHEVLI